MGRNLADVEYKMRMTQDLKDKIVESAKKHNRSMNADIVARLEQSFGFSTDITAEHIHSLVENIEVYQQEMINLGNLVKSQTEMINQLSQIIELSEKARLEAENKLLINSSNKNM
ncbi:Arc family DNA-binding protein [Acinetobacter pittii]|uniref:Arc family DNA-binding protein n=1 Tax=Acinetobacter pittii TaxID=48296 RepID=UPI002A08A8E1|nr:Arc family DNA-binding protein [Acinetobacter pittii]MDX8164940.1 Arc family DNA-binding protein [Acinetobacter pittii]